MKAYQVVLINLLLCAIGILAMTLGSTFNVPDLLRVDYGWPFVWGRHTLSTIAGPVDLWSVDPGMLAVDLLIWLAVVIAPNVLWIWKGNRSDNSRVPNIAP